MSKFNLFKRTRVESASLSKVDSHKVENRNWSYLRDEKSTMLSKKDLASNKKNASEFRNYDKKAFNPILTQ